MARHETRSGYMAETQCQGIRHKAQIRQEKLMIMHSQLDIRGVQREKGQHKIQEEYEALAKCHGITIQQTPGPKRGLPAWAPNAKGS